MKKIFFTLILLLSTLNARDGYGYALFGIGGQSATYHEVFRAADGSEIAMSGTIDSPYYYTGTGVKFNELIDFSLSGSSTLYANSTDDANIDFPFKDVDHSMDLMNSDLMFYTHYKWTQKQHLLLGVGYSNETIKRFLFQDTALPTNTILETNTISGNVEVGYLYTRDPRIGKLGWNYMFGLMVGMPVFTSVTQIYSEKLDEEEQFLSSTYGFSLKPTFYIGYRIFEGFDLAVSVDYYYRVRFDDTKIVYNSENYTGENSILERYRSGVFAIWNFD